MGTRDVIAGRPRSVALSEAGRRLAAAGIGAPQREARLLMRWAIGFDAAALAIADDLPLTEGEAERFEAALAARERRKPMAQIVGERLFWGRTFRVTPAVLDPRPETEGLISAALEGPAPRRVADLGTGSGCILVTLLVEWPGASGIGTDLSADALAIASENAERHGVAARATFLETSWLEGVEGRFDLILSNPPYIAASELPMLAPEVRDHEPRSALVPDPDPGGDGLGAYRAIAAAALQHLVPGGRLLLEIGHAQGLAVSGLLRAAGLESVETRPDLDGRDRVVTGRKPLS
ncbi:MAG: peptide chain release factor N(5)-glutamine methyltransferase [Pseudomonadota bacterium]